METIKICITMENGKEIHAELYPSVAPKTVENFVALVNDHFYDGLIFHRVIPGFMIQGGDPLGNGMGGSKETIPGEFAANGFQNDLKHERGVLSMARHGSQFGKLAVFHHASECPAFRWSVCGLWKSD